MTTKETGFMKVGDVSVPIFKTLTDFTVNMMKEYYAVKDMNYLVEHKNHLIYQVQYADVFKNTSYSRLIAVRK